MFDRSHCAINLRFDDKFIQPRYMLFMYMYAVYSEFKVLSFCNNLCFFSISFVNVNRLKISITLKPKGSNKKEKIPLKKYLLILIFAKTLFQIPKKLRFGH